MSGFIHYNGELVPANEKLVTARNRGLRYGDGLFETMKLVNGKIRLDTLHFERLFQGLKTLQFELPDYLSPAFVTGAVVELCRKNNLEAPARVRLNIFRGTIEEKYPSIVIEAEPIPGGYNSFNEKGLAIDIYKEAKKSCDTFSNLKSNNYLPYLMAANFAKNNGLNDALLLNSYDRICDASIANIFWVKHNQVFTPPLSEGCVAGVMRRYLIEKLRSAGYAIEEMICTKQKLSGADEIFLTNALFGIRWVQQLKDKTYTNKLSAQLYKQFIQSL